MITDMHAHPTFLVPGGEAWAAEPGVRVLCATVSPEDYDTARARFGASPDIRVGLGLHPWYVSADETAAKARVEAVLERLRPGMAVAEAGLDFGPKHRDTAATQTAAFRAVAQAATRQGGCLLSLHSVQATETVLDVLDAAGFWDDGTAVFHWFSGSSAHLSRALKAGAFFSLNPHMLQTRKGREYARVLPSDRLLLETDLPDADGAVPGPLSGLLENLVSDLAELRGCETTALADIIENNASALLAGLK